MALNNIQPRPNHTSSFVQEPFFSKMQRFDKYGGIFIPVLSNEDLEIIEEILAIYEN